ncbi:hypothetical protein ISS07_02235 [Candidatus Woesearchaeota archaeon]|nr:hypothetical protein [Candidatus Woesearchaeota archaeon]
MSKESEFLEKSMETFKPVQRCPKCNKLSLSYADGKLRCSECSFEENIPEIK